MPQLDLAPKVLRRTFACTQLILNRLHLGGMDIVQLQASMATRVFEKDRRSAASASSTRKRAQRKGRKGNTEGVIKFLRANPDTEAGAVVTHLGVARGVIYNLLRRLVEQGILEKTEGDNGRARYRLVAETSEQQQAEHSGATL